MTIQTLLNSRKFWLALLALAYTTLYTVKPDFPEDIWNSANELLITLIVTLTIETSARFVVTRYNPDVNSFSPALPEGSRLPWLLQSRKFWLAVIAFAASVLFYYVPDFPRNVWDAINNVFIVVMAMYTVEDVSYLTSQAIRQR